MLGSFIQRLDINFRRFLPSLTVLLFIILSAVSWPLPYFGEISPCLGLIAIYYWSIYRPDLLRLPTAFLSGVLHDVIHFLPFGITAVVYIAVRQIVLKQRRFFAGQSFLVLWSGFAVVSVMVMIAQWIIVSIYRKEVIPISPVFIQFILTVLIFPLPAWLLIQLQRIVFSQQKERR